MRAAYFPDSDTIRAAVEPEVDRIRAEAELLKTMATGPAASHPLYAAATRRIPPGELCRRIARREIEPKIGKRLLNETTRADWTGLVAAKRKVAPAMASSMFRIVASFLSYAEAQGWIAAPLLPRKGAAMLAPAPEPRQRALTEGEIIEVWRAAGKEPPKLRAFLRLLILTACRAMDAADVA